MVKVGVSEGHCRSLKCEDRALQGSSTHSAPGQREPWGGVGEGGENRVAGARGRGKSPEPHGEGGSDFARDEPQKSGYAELSRVRLFATLWTVSRQALLSMGFSRREYWSGLPFSYSRESS